MNNPERKNRIGFVPLALRTQQVFNDSEINVYSGYATLYLLMALVPLIILLVGAVNLLPEDYLKSFMDLFVGLFPQVPQIQAFANELLSRVDPHSGTIVISISVLTSLWSASNGVSALQLGLQKISGTTQPILLRRAIALVYTLLFIILIPMLLIFRVLRGSLEGIIIALMELLQLPEVATRVVDVLESSGLITMTAVAFIVLMTYTYLQGHVRKIRLQLPGAVFSIVLWQLFSALFEIFITRFWTASSLYGSLAAIFLTAMWLKTIITILFLGACLNAAILQLREEKEAEAGERYDGFGFLEPLLHGGGFGPTYKNGRPDVFGKPENAGTPEHI